MFMPLMQVLLHLPSTLKHIAVVTNANLSFTRGLIWLQDVHYNADKGGPAIAKKTHVCLGQRGF